VAGGSVSIAWGAASVAGGAVSVAAEAISVGGGAVFVAAGAASVARGAVPAAGVDSAAGLFLARFPDCLPVVFPVASAGFSTGVSLVSPPWKCL